MKQRRFACLSSLCLLALVGCGEASAPIHKSQTLEAGSSTALTPAGSSSPVNPTSSPAPSANSSAISYLPAESILFFTGLVDYYTGMSIRITKPTGDTIALTYPSYHEDAESYDITIEKQATDWEDGSAAIKPNADKLKEFLAAKHYDPALAGAALDELEPVAIVLPARYFFSLGTGGVLNSQDYYLFRLASGSIAKGAKVSYRKNQNSNGKSKSFTIGKAVSVQISQDAYASRTGALAGDTVRLIPSNATHTASGSVGTAVFYSPELTVNSVTTITLDFTVLAAFDNTGDYGYHYSYCFNGDTEFSDYLSSFGNFPPKSYEAGETIKGVTLSFPYGSRFTAYEGAKVGLFRPADEGTPILLEATVHF